MRENVFCSDTLGFAHDTSFDVPGHCVAVPTENCIFEILLVALTRKSGLRPTGHFRVDPLDVIKSVKWNPTGMLLSDEPRSH